MRVLTTIPNQPVKIDNLQAWRALLPSVADARAAIFDRETMLTQALCSDTNHFRLARDLVRHGDGTLRHHYADRAGLRVGATP